MNLKKLAEEVGRDWDLPVDRGPAAELSYYDIAETVIDRQWEQLIWPIIRFADFSSVLELAPGRGRNTAKLLPLCKRIVVADINQTNIDFLRRRFSGEPRIKYLRTSGVDLDGVTSESIAFIYCFDSMVHFDSDVVRAYLKEFFRVLGPGGVGFCHYSDTTDDPGGSYRNHPGWRNFMSRELFQHYACKEGLRVIKSWGIEGNIAITNRRGRDVDAISLFERSA